MSSGLEPINNGDTLESWKEKINNAILHVNTIDVSGQDWQYAGSFSASDFSKYGEYYKLKILPSVHGLGSSVALKLFLRQDEEKWSNVIFSYKVYVDGTITVITQETFSGKYVISREV